MRAIIIDDKDCRALLESLSLESLTAPPDGHVTRGLKERGAISQSDLQKLKEEIHAQFHYRVTRWLQDQGASIVRGG